MPKVERSTLGVVVATILVAAALKLAQPIMVPLVAGIFLAVVARPIQRSIARSAPRRLRWLGLLAAMVVVIAGVAAFGAALGLSARAVNDEMRARRPQIEAALRRSRNAAQRLGIPQSAFPSLPGGGGGDESAGGGAGSGGSAAAASEGQVEVRRVASGVVTGLGGLLLALAFCALALAEADGARRRLRRAVPSGTEPSVLGAVDEVTDAFRRYAWVKSLASAITGVATALASLALGLPLAAVWGFLAFLLEYIPTVGSALAVIPPTLMALAVGGPTRALVVFLVVGGLQVILSNLVDPRLDGRFMRISPFVVLLSIVVWGWLWGPVGALLAVPMTVALVIAARHTPGARGIATLASSDHEEGNDGDDQ